MGNQTPASEESPARPHHERNIRTSAEGTRSIQFLVKQGSRPFGGGRLQEPTFRRYDNAQYSHPQGQLHSNANVCFVATSSEKFYARAAGGKKAKRWTGDRTWFTFGDRLVSCAYVLREQLKNISVSRQGEGRLPAAALVSAVRPGGNGDESLSSAYGNEAPMWVS